MADQQGGSHLSIGPESPKDLVTSPLSVTRQDNSDCSNTVTDIYHHLHHHMMGLMSIKRYKGQPINLHIKLRGGWHNHTDTAWFTLLRLNWLNLCDLFQYSRMSVELLQFFCFCSQTNDQVWKCDFFFLAHKCCLKENSNSCAAALRRQSESYFIHWSHPMA